LPPPAATSVAAAAGYHARWKPAVTTNDSFATGFTGLQCPRIGRTPLAECAAGKPACGR
jgi:hypothetical protein